ncbi:MAG: hypothetical protein A2Y71_08400 [Bacteroidetes bacterium RBG_13_42_15]|nr:MAG: hypothetical protein A2Y71_08400 [Bacteroidetes bacterium RBG_13_42_15]
MAKCKSLQFLINKEYYNSYIDDDFFIGKELIEQYKIKSGSNFPLKLSNTHYYLRLGGIKNRLTTVPSDILLGIDLQENLILKRRI